MSCGCDCCDWRNCAALERCMCRCDDEDEGDFDADELGIDPEEKFDA